MAAFQEISLPSGLAKGARGGPRRKTTVVTLDSGFEERNASWANSRREWDLGYALTDAASLHALIEFFEARNGRLYGFRFRDFSDDRSVAPTSAISATDQVIGTGDAVTTAFQLVKTYGTLSPWVRTISKPVAGSVLIALDGAPQGSGWSVDTTTGIVTFDVAPGASVVVTAGYKFEVPVRFDTDQLDIAMDYEIAGEIPAVRIVEIRT